MSGVLEGKVALVTGAGRGIGRGIAVEYAREGARVAVVSRSPGPISETLEEIRSVGGTAISVSCDLAEHDAIKGAVASTVEAFGGIDILVNCAHSFGSKARPLPGPIPCPLDQFDDEVWDYNLLTGPTATYRMMKAAFPYLKASGQGRIINFGSAMGAGGFPGVAAYSTAKEGIRALSRIAAADWGVHGITVNIINPVLETDAYRGYRDADPEAVAQAMSAVPLRRIGDIYADGGRLAVFLAGPDASYMTGMTFKLDGGMYMGP